MDFSKEKALDLCFTSLQVNAESYKIVIKRLHDNFGKPELLMAGTPSGIY